MRYENAGLRGPAVKIDCRHCRHHGKTGCRPHECWLCGVLVKCRQSADKVQTLQTFSTSIVPPLPRSSRPAAFLVQLPGLSRAKRLRHAAPHHASAQVAMKRRVQDKGRDGRMAGPHRARCCYEATAFQNDARLHHRAQMSLPVHLRPSSEQTQRASVGGIFGGIFRKRNFLALLNQSLAEIVGLPFGHHVHAQPLRLGIFYWRVI